jgi:hypothetical protein
MSGELPDGLTGVHVNVPVGGMLYRLVRDSTMLVSEEAKTFSFVSLPDVLEV